MFLRKTHKMKVIYTKQINPLDMIVIVLHRVVSVPGLYIYMNIQLWNHHSVYQLQLL
jgi:hypothetical protein